MIDKNSAFVGKVVIEGLTNLAAALQWYWPAKLGKSGKKEDAYFLPIQEQNLIMYLGASFLNNGFLVFNEVNLLDEAGSVTNQKMDMLVIHLQYDIEIYVEAKGNIESATGNASTDTSLQLLADYKRMQTHTVEKYQHLFSREANCLEREHRYSLIITTSQQDNVRNWWIGSGEAIPLNRKASIWSDIHAIMLTSEKLLDRWSIPLKTSAPYDKSRIFTAHALYALLKRPDMQLK